MPQVKPIIQIFKVLLVPVALTFGLAYFSGKSWRPVLEGQFWLGILNAALPSAIAIPVPVCQNHQRLEPLPGSGIGTLIN